MGHRMRCITNPKTEVMQGDAKPPEKHCITPPPPKGGGGGGDALSVWRAEVMQNAIKLEGFPE